MTRTSSEEPKPGDRSHATWIGYATAAIAIAVATIVRQVLGPVLGGSYPFVTFFGAVTLVAWYGRTAPAVFTLVTGGLLSLYLFTPLDVGAWLGLGLYVIVAAVIIGMSHAMRRASSRAEHLIAQAAERQEELRQAVISEAGEREGLSIVLACIRDAVITTDTEGRVTRVNPVAERLTGWTAAEASGMLLTQVCHIVDEATREPAASPGLRLLKDGVDVGLGNNLVLIGKDGTERRVERSTAAIRGEGAEIVGSVLVLRDITDRNKLEASRREAREHMAATLESVSDGFIRYDREWRMVYVNAEAERINRLERGQMLGRTLWELFPAVLGTTLETELRRAMAERVIVEFENRYAPWGRWYALKAYPAPDGGLTTFIRDITVEKAQRDNLAASEARLRELADAMPQMVYSSDAEGRVDFANRQWMDYTGQTDVQTADLGAVVHPDDLGELVQRWQSARTTGTALETEFRLRRASDSAYRWFLTRAVPVRDSTGGVVKWFGTSTDIHDQKRTEQKLAESEARYRAIGESIDFGVWVCDATGRNTYASDSFLRTFGLTQQQCSEFGWGDVLHPDDAEETIAAWKECVRTQRHWERVHRFKGVNGTWYSVLARGVPLSNAAGEILGWAGINLDITRFVKTDREVVRIAAESERQRRLYETVLTNTPDFMYVFSLDHKVLYANDALIKMWGVGHEGAIGKTFLEIGYEPWHAEMHDREIDQVRATRQPIRGEVPFSGTLGRRQYDYIFVPVIGSDGEVEAVAGTTRDVTERKEAERQLQEGQAQLDFALAAADLGQWSLNLGDHTTHRTLRHDQIFGYQALLPEWTYETFLEHVVPNDRKAVDAGFRESVATGTAWTVECRIRRADGAVRYIWTKALIRREAGGEFERMLGIVGDLTDRRLDEAQQAFEIRLAETLRPLFDPVEVQAEASRLLGQHLSANRVVYFEILGDEYVIERDYTAGVRPLAGRYPVASFGPALLTELMDGRTVIEADATTEPDRPPAERAAFAAIQVRGHVDVPLVKGGRFLAGMTVQVSDQRQWTAREVSLIEDTAERTWAAVERVRAEAALRQSEERLAFVRRSSGIGFWYCDLPFDVLRWDDLVKAHFHLPPDAIVTIQTFYDRLHPEDREPTRQAIERSIAARTPYNVEYRTVHPDTGAITWLRAIGRTFYDADGTPTRFDGVTLDVSDQKRAEASLRESEQRFRLVADAAPVLIWLSGTDKLVSWYNRPWLEFTGRSMEQEVGNGATEVVHPDDLGRGLKTYTDAFDTRSPFSMEYRLRRHDGEFRWMICNGVPRYRPDGEFAGYIGSCLDVTDYKDAQARLQEADRRKDEFLATLAHELRNPLAPIRSGLQVIRMTGADGTIEQARSMMERQLLQLTRLVDDLLDVNRVTTGKLELRRERLELGAVIAAAMETSQPVIEQHGHSVTIVAPDEPIFVDGDAVRLAQIVSNLLTNSAKYTHRGGHIRISVARHDATAVVAVTDNGIGIPPHMLETVFAMFTQVDRTLEKTTGGLGIGLSLVKGLVEMHGGTIEARSEGEGRGSEFTLRLPVAAPSLSEPRPGAARLGTVESVSRRRILIVDDNVDAADSLGQLLEIMGNEVRMAYDGEAGITTAKTFRPNVVLCDIGMPKMNGYDTARGIRAEAWSKDTVLVALTGLSQQDDLQKSAQAGFDHHLTKPVDADALIELLASLQPQTA